MYKALDTSTCNLAESSLSMTSLGDKDRGLVFVYTIEEVVHAHVETAPLERFFSIPRLAVVSRLLSEICQLRIR